MDDLIYSVSALRAFSGSIIGCLILFLLGLGTPILTLFNRKESVFKKIATVFLGLIILSTGVLIMLGSYRQYQGGDKTILVQVLEKRESTGWCNRRLCTDYTAETSDGEKRYIFNLKEKVWNEIEVHSCYKFTYYPFRPLFSGLAQGEYQYPSLYEPTGEITSIQKVDCS